jgi:hypothetical protein
VGETELVVPDQLAAMDSDEFGDKTAQTGLQVVWSSS